MGIVRRAGYSRLEAGAWIRPHTGPSNAQLKLHLGLTVPRGALVAEAEQAGSSSLQSNCSSLRVGGAARRGWREGRVLMFDDSFEHDVWNNCAPSPPPP